MVPKGSFLACRDPTVLFSQLSARWKERIEAEHDHIGYALPHDDYFNSGVLVIERESWPALSLACQEMVRDKGASLRHPDQDILNLAIGDRCKLISNRWNFPGFLIGAQTEKTISPCIYHFMSNPRPWNVAVPPWGEVWARPYADLLKAHPELGFLAPTKKAHAAVRYWLQQQYKIAAYYHAVGRINEPRPDIAV